MGFWQYKEITIMNKNTKFEIALSLFMLLLSSSIVVLAVSLDLPIIVPYFFASLVVLFTTLILANLYSYRLMNRHKIIHADRPKIMKKVNKVVWVDGGNLFVVNKAKTANKKITDGSKIVQTYTFSIKQWELATTSKGFKMNDFFALDGSNCLDCPFSVSSGDGGCYTHKFQQYSGMLMMLRSIKAESLTPLDKEKYRNIMDMSHDTYIRFGTYGEPSLLPIALVESMSLLSKSWTGYTHQWKKEWASDYGKYFMASAHNQDDANKAKEIEYRSFIATKDGTEKAVGCPASKEMGFKTNCAKCGLCSGTEGKGKTDIKILEH